jgi:hypothetical protein
MGTNDREKVILLQEGTGGSIGEHVRAAACFVKLEKGLNGRGEVFHRVSPEQVAHGSLYIRLRSVERREKKVDSRSKKSQSTIMQRARE